MIKMKDCRGRNIDGKILQVMWLDVDQHPDSVKKNEVETCYTLCEEFFLNDASPAVAVPAMFAATCNSAYMGWQKVTLAMLGKELLRPKGQQFEYGINEFGVDRYTISEAGQFDQAMERVVWYRFLKNQEGFLRNCNGITYYQSAGVKRQLLTMNGFEFCGFIPSEVQARDCLGFETTGLGMEFWAHPAGVITSFESELKGPALYTTPDMYIKRPGDHRFERIGGGSQSYCSGSNGMTPGTVTYYQTASFRHYFNIWKATKDPNVIPHWGEGTDGLRHIGVACRAEWTAQPYFNEEYYEEGRRKFVQLAKEYPLLKRICFDKE